MANKPTAVEAEAEREETYDAWFRRQVQMALDAADAPDAIWHSHEDVMFRGRARRAAILDRMKTNGAN